MALVTAFTLVTTSRRNKLKLDPKCFVVEGGTELRWLYNEKKAKIWCLRKWDGCHD